MRAFGLSTKQPSYFQPAGIVGVLEALEVELVDEALAEAVEMLELDVDEMLVVLVLDVETDPELLELDVEEMLVVLVLEVETDPELLLMAEATPYKSNLPEPPQNSVAFAAHTILQSVILALAPPLEIWLPQSASNS